MTHTSPDLDAIRKLARSANFLATRLRERNKRLQTNLGNYLYYGEADGIIDYDAARTLSTQAETIEQMKARAEAVAECVKHTGDAIRALLNGGANG